MTRRSVLGTLLASSIPCIAYGQTLAVTERMQVRFAFSTHVFTATLDDNPTAQDLWSLLPLDLTFEDYSSNEKIAYLPRKLSRKGSGPFGKEALGDLCYYAPWGNLVFYHHSYRYSAGLIRLGRLDDDYKPLLTRGKFPLHAQRV